MVSIARAMALAPSLMILDEAFEGLAPVVVKRFRDAVMMIKGLGISLLLAESNLTSAAAIADRLYVIDRGEIIFHGTPKEALANENVMRTLRGMRPARSHGAMDYGDEEARCIRARWSRRPSSQWRGAATSCRSIPPSIRTRSRSRRSLPSARPSALRDGKIHAYVGHGLSFAGAPPDRDPRDRVARLLRHRARQSGLDAGDGRDCGLRAPSRPSCASLREPSDFVPHPYPVTPLHGDYLHHADLAAAAKARFADGDAPVRDLKVKASGSLAQSHPEWSAHDADWDVEVVEVDAAELIGIRDAVR